MYLIYNNKQTLKLYINRIFKFNDITIFNILFLNYDDHVKSLNAYRISSMHSEKLLDLN